MAGVLEEDAELARPGRRDVAGGGRDREEVAAGEHEAGDAEGVGELERRGHWYRGRGAPGEVFGLAHLTSASAGRATVAA